MFCGQFISQIIRAIRHLRAFDGVEEGLTVSVEPVLVLDVQPVEPLQQSPAVCLQRVQLVQPLLEPAPWRGPRRVWRRRHRRLHPADGAKPVAHDDRDCGERRETLETVGVIRVRNVVLFAQCLKGKRTIGFLCLPACPRACVRACVRACLPRPPARSLARLPTLCVYHPLFLSFYVISHSPNVFPAPLCPISLSFTLSLSPPPPFPPALYAAPYVTLRGRNFHVHNTPLTTTPAV